MKYIKGFVHDSFTETYYYELNMDFTFVVCNNVRYSEMNNYDKESYGLDIYKGYTICIKFFKNSEDSSVFCYLEGYYDLTGVYTEINQETLMSRDFITANANWDVFQIDRMNGKLLLNVTREFNRDKKIDLILE